MKSQNRIFRYRALLICAMVLACVLIGLICFALWLDRPNGQQPPTQSSAASSATENTPAMGTTESPPGDPTDPVPSADTGQTEPPATEPSATVPPVTEPAQTQPPVTQRPPEPSVEVPPATEKVEEIVIQQFAVFSGVYVEDGRDELVENVAAVLVTNVTDRFLDLAEIRCDIGGEDAVFRVTGLPAGRSAWVMEYHKMTISIDAQPIHLETITSFRDNVTAETEKVKLYSDGSLMKAENQSEEVLYDVFVYYKVRHSDGNFLGGITYVVNFGTLEPGAAAEATAGHFTEAAEIVRIGFRTASDHES